MRMACPRISRSTAPTLRPCTLPSFAPETLPGSSPAARAVAPAGMAFRMMTGSKVILPSEALTVLTMTKSSSSPARLRSWSASGRTTSNSCGWSRSPEMSRRYAPGGTSLKAKKPPSLYMAGRATPTSSTRKRCGSTPPQLKSSSTCPISDAFFAICSAVGAGGKRRNESSRGGGARAKGAAGSFFDDETRYRDDKELAHLLDLDDGVDLFQLPAVGQVYDAPFEQVIAVQLIQHDERVGRVDVGDFEPDLLGSLIPSFISVGPGRRWRS